MPSRQPAHTTLGRLVKRKVIRPRGLRPIRVGPTMAEMLAADGIGQTQLEKMVSAAARQANIWFDEMDGREKKKVPLTIAGQWSIPDFSISHPPTLIYVDGPQHDLRLEREQKDVAETAELESMGYRVIRLNWREIMADPVGLLQRTLALG